MTRFIIWAQFGLLLFCLAMWYYQCHPRPPIERNASSYPSLKACLDDIYRRGGGRCVIDDRWNGTAADIVDSQPRERVSILDKRQSGR